MILEETYTLSNGVKIPKLGLGTWLLDDAQAAAAVKAALDAGYRHVDTAQAYENEVGVGEGLSAAGVARDQVFVTTKVRAEHKDYASTAASIDESLQKLGLDYLDLIIIHAPQPWVEFRNDTNRYFAENLETWRAMEDAVVAGKVRAIGVSNFLADDLANIVTNAATRPAVNQVLAHVGNVPRDVVAASQKDGILVEAYSPVAHGALLQNEVVKAVAAKYDVTVPQLCIRYVLQLGFVALPKSGSAEHIRSNAEVDFEISVDDMTALDAVKPLETYGDDSFFPVFATQLNK